MGQTEARGNPSQGNRTRFRALSVTLTLGAVYDGIFAMQILFTPHLLASLLGLSVPPEPIYLRLNGIFLLILALFYLVTAIDPGRYLGNVPVAIVGRILGGVFFFACGLRASGETVFLLLGVLDLFFASLHAWALGPAGWSRLRDALRPGSRMVS